MSKKILVDQVVAEWALRELEQVKPLADCDDNDEFQHHHEMLEAIRTALAEPAVEPQKPECYKWEEYRKWAKGWGWDTCETEYDPRLPENARYHKGTEFNDPEQVRNFRALFTSPPPPAEVPEGSVCARCGGLVFDPVIQQPAGAAQFNAAIDFAITQGLEAADFLDAWRHGDTSEWPEFAQPAEAQPAAARSGVFGYLDGEVRKDMAGFYEAFDRPQPPPPTPRPMSDREWAAQPADLREGCTKHVPGVGDI